MATRLQKKLAGEASEYQGDSSDSEQTPETRETLKYKIELRKLELEDKQREREREDKQREREREDKQREREDKQREREWEEKRWEQEKELKIMQLEKDKEIELRRLELEKEKLALSQPHIINQEGNGRTEASDLLLKRFPKFNKDDDVEKFLISFERCCRDFEIDEGKWMLYLRPQICGKLLEIYGDVPEELHRDYNFFKKQVQQKLQLTPEFYRLKFRSLRKEKAQSFSEVASKQAQLFDSWLRTSEVETFQQLRELIKLEQLFQLVPSDYRWLVQDRKPSTANEAASMTDQLITLREGFRNDEGLSERRQNKPPFYNYQTHTQYKKTPAVENTAYRRPEVINQTKPEVKARCYQCGKSDHLKYQCPLLRRDKTSFFMNKEPKENTLNSDIKLLSSTETVPREKQCLFILSDDFSEDYFEPITIVNQQKQGWRDTGSQVCVIHPKSVPQKYQKPTSEINLKGLGPAVPAEVVSLPIEYNGWKGIWDFAISSDIPHECLIGNDLARQVKNWKKLCEEKEDYNRSPIQEAVCLPIQPESEQGPESSSAIIEIVSKTGGVQEIKQAQEEDESLKPLFKQAESLLESAGELPNKFVTKDGVFYRESKSVESEERSEIHSQSFTEIERQAQVAEKLKEQQAAEYKKQADEALVASMRLTYQELHVDRKKEEKKLQNLEGKKWEQAERLGMGLVSRSSISHSVLSEMQVIEQETPVTTKSTRSQLDLFEDIGSFTSGPPKYKDNPFSLGDAFSSQWETDNSSWEMDKGEEEADIAISSIRPIGDRPINRRETESKISVVESNEAQQKFAGAKVISSDMFFGREADTVPVAEYLTDLQSTMRVARDIAQEHLAVAQQRQKSYYDRSAKPRSKRRLFFDGESGKDPDVMGIGSFNYQQFTFKILQKCLDNVSQDFLNDSWKFRKKTFWDRESSLCCWEGRV
ncbi:trichohyalin-like [Anolis carolinensis]|uniref:trichohyalin-like n=1 Tax=Anolis carolinensis TaxID=28377 RepID=UPI002F2B5E81